MPQSLSDRLARCYTGVVHDVMRGMGLRDFTLPSYLRPLLPERTMAGPAFTIEGKVDSNADAHATLLAWTGLLSQARAGHVWVSQPNDRIVANMGELSAETLKNKGLRGCVVDGGCRDTNFIMNMEFQCWFEFYTPRDVVGHWLPTHVDRDIRIGDVVIAPGDFMLGDRDGLIRIPQARIHDVIAKAEADIAKENMVRTAILQGVDPQKAYLQFGKF